MSPKKVSGSITEINRVMMPHHANTMGTVHGGFVLGMIDEAAFICACRHSSSECVTASVDRVIFRSPIRVGEVVRCIASVNYVGETSMEVGVRVESEDLKSGKFRHTNSCHLTMVAVDKAGKPTKVPKVIPETEEEKRRYEEGKARREKMKELLRAKRQNAG